MLFVTLHVSVWVEIYGDKAETLRAESRSTWACELKCWEVALSAAPWGHAPRERVSWNVYGRHIGLVSVVTLHVSVWVEIVLFSIFRLVILVTLHVSVWVEIKSTRIWLKSLQGHAPRERVSWNTADTLNWKNALVTLHVSVWVEIDLANQYNRDVMSRSTWACELKCRNPTTLLRLFPSRSTWACELKFRACSNR